MCSAMAECSGGGGGGGARRAKSVLFELSCPKGSYFAVRTCNRFSLLHTDLSAAALCVDVFCRNGQNCVP